MTPSVRETLHKDEVLRYFRLQVSPKEAESHWQAVLAAHRLVTASHVEMAGLDIRATALDYFLKNGMLVDPVVVENDSLAVAYEMAYHDRLTGLHNYAYFEDESRLEVSRALRYGHSVALVLVDLDGFKAVNDQFGHQAGNEVLESVAEGLREGFRTGDVLARLGGDEFALLLHCADQTTGLLVATRIRKAIERRFGQGGTSVADAKITASLGVAAIPEHASSEALFAAADQALYYVKKLGGNRVGFERNGHLTCMGLFAERYLGRCDERARPFTRTADGNQERASFRSPSSELTLTASVGARRMSAS